MKLTTDELIIFERLMTQNRDNVKLQNIAECSYLESITLLNKLGKMLEK